MKSLKEDINEQLQKCLNTSSIDEIEKIYIDKLQKIFTCIYMINYFSNRIEIKNKFDSSYFNISKSCLIESFELLINNYLRASSLVLRSSLENFIKHIIKIYLSEFKGLKYKIDDRSYSANKATLDKIINSHITQQLTKESESINSKMENQYKALSGLSHSLVEESKNNILNYFDDLRKVKEDNIVLVMKHFMIVVECIFSFALIMCETSLKNWESSELKEIINLVFGKRKTKTYLRILKQ